MSAAAQPSDGPDQPYLLAAYPFRHEVAARFADVDSLGHLNNVAIAAFYEDARVSFLRESVRLGEGSVGFGSAFPVVLAEITIRYLAEAHYPGTYTIGVGVARVGRSSLVNDCGLFLGDTCVGTCRSVVVHVGDDHRAAPIPDVQRTSLERYLFRPYAGPHAVPSCSDFLNRSPSVARAADVDKL